MTENQKDLSKAEKHLDSLAGKMAAEDRARYEAQKESDVVTPIVLAWAIGIRPQMVYNYINQGRIPAHKDAETQKWVINRTDALNFVSKRMERSDAKKALVEAQLQG